MKRPNIYSRPLNSDNYHSTNLNKQYVNNLNTYIDYLENLLKKSYSEEEVFKIVTQMDIEVGVGDGCGPTTRNKWFEQFKKK